METLNQWWNQASELLGKLNGAPAGMLDFVLCIALGYALRWIKRFPNDAIPIVIILWGGLFLLLIAEDAPVKLRIWMGRNLGIGIIIGVAAWLFHKLVLRRVEKKFGWFQDVDAAKVECQTEILEKKALETE